MSGNQSKSVNKHSPGPWRIRSGEILLVDGDSIALVSDDCETSAEYRANCELIAAAPDLMAAAEGLLNAIETGSNMDKVRAKIALAEAVAKARGEG